MSNQPNSNLSLQKQSRLPPDLPSTDNNGNRLPQLLAVPRSCDAAAGINWLFKAAIMLKNNLLLWIGISLSFIFIVGVLGYIPVIGILFSLMSLILIGGIIKGAAAQAQGNELRFNDLFSGFKTHLQPLIVLCLLYIVGIVVVLIPMFIAFGGMILSILFNSSSTNIDAFSGGAILIGGSLSLLLFIPLLMAIWFAPALIVLHDVDAVEAMKKSFKGSAANLLPMFVYSVVAVIVFSIFVTITIGIGLIVVIPLIMITYYTSYRDVWTDQPLSKL